MEKEKSSREVLDKSKSGDKPKALWWQPGLVLFSKLSGWIGGPIILAVFIGKWLDRKYQTEPWLFLASVGAAFFISTFAIVKEALREMKKIDSEFYKTREKIEDREKSSDKK